MATNNRAKDPFVGLWITTDGHIRHNLFPNGRYDEARGRRESAYPAAATTSDTASPSRAMTSPGSAPPSWRSRLPTGSTAGRC
ncbi:hypothetical protein EB230_29315 [Mesorhizobium sp. NZP2234]|nr:hypothetical protein EB230_29315 [Mesorhizobium sp. NZP2234]